MDLGEEYSEEFVESENMRFQENDSSEMSS